MIDSNRIYKTAKRVIKKASSDNLYDIADSRNITVKQRNLGSLLGMYCNVCNNRYIYLNDCMDEISERMVLAHEIGHDCLHRDLAKGIGMQEFDLFNMRNETEYEANAIAAHLLISDDDVMEYAKMGYDIVQMANMFNVNINLALIKVQEMMKLGYFVKVPFESDGTFLKNLKIQDN